MPGSRGRGKLRRSWDVCSSVAEGLPGMHEAFFTPSREKGRRGGEGEGEIGERKGGWMAKGPGTVSGLDATDEEDLG